jgi:hypothetical protein
MAGSHQIWRYGLKDGVIRPWAGSGRENLADGPLREANFAQPSGLATDGARLFSADSESSSLRVMPLSGQGGVATVIGKGLFEFGDAEGAKETARLQHPLGVFFKDGLLYVADTFNNRLKTVDSQSGETRFLAGSGAQGFRDGPAAQARFDEPGGLSLAGGLLYVADTNNHAVRVLDLKSGTVSTFHLKGAER